MLKVCILLVSLYHLIYFDNCGGTYRWDNKILIDPAGLQIYKIRPKPATIDRLVKIQKPNNASLGSKRALAENRKLQSLHG